MQVKLLLGALTSGIGVLGTVSACLFPIQLPATMSWLAADNGSGISVFVTYMGGLYRGLNGAWLQAGHLGNESEAA